MEREAAAKRAEQVQSPQIRGIVSIVQRAFETNQRHRRESGVEDQMLANLRQRNGEYDPQKLALIKQMGGTDVFLKFTNVKCRAAESWIADIYGAQASRTWEARPTPIPQLPTDLQDHIVQEVTQAFVKTLATTGEVMQPSDAFDMASTIRDQLHAELMEEAQHRAKRMQDRIDDQLVEGSWDEAFDDTITDLVTLKAGIVKGPIFAKHDILRWRQTNAKTVPVWDRVDKPMFFRVSPFDVYPGPNALTPEDGEFIERVRFFPADLVELIGETGYDDAAIRLVLHDYRAGGLREWTSIDEERAGLEKTGQSNLALKDSITGLEYNGSVQGQDLLNEGFKTDARGKKIDPLGEYEVNAVVIGNYCIFKGLNPDRRRKRLYSHCGYEKVAGSFWFKGVPELMDDLQQIVNATIRSLVNNMPLSSGPLTVYNDIARLAPGQDPQGIQAWGVYQFINKTQSTVNPITFHNIESHAAELMGVYDQFSKMADDFTGIPAYSYGNDQVAGAGRTYSGLSVLMNSAARGIKKVMARIHRMIVAPNLQRLYEHNMLFDPDESIKGDCQINTVGLMALIVKEQLQQRRQEFMDRLLSPAGQVVAGLEGVAEAFREQATSLELPAKVIKTEDQIKQIAQRQEQQQGMMDALAMRQAAAQTQQQEAAMVMPPGGTQ